ncbi:uncharacterized protein LOC133836953 [Drosophila sulfurigaster albostrigata]|uniref:uncharacterized protein LOC133836953 n=1 Tax=Drosophila sulfurigaster albostrigata TaxID=89887 RepID=UPI002D21D22B|nr:uncharacterized protein LOC133836953 [Drosophila sulfurigaster albostrigata]XP_062123562.1 uncharacterized protein LOC133836953 [Drosophila sulfurigaster albostrigata]XP_062123563.1 uncharacterized protein LOC133836953 [Drosophila sulfurigaster albostrigata]
MAAQVIIVLLLAISWTHGLDLSSLENFSCRNHQPAPFDIDTMEGLWYEAGRAPASPALACLNVTVPDSVDNGDIELYLEYIDTHDGSNKVVKEPMKFPWDDSASKGIFNVYYGSSKQPVAIYKVVLSEPSYITVICGYTTKYAAAFLKIFTRSREVDNSTKEIVAELMAKSKYSSFFLCGQSNRQTNAMLLPGNLHLV